MGETGVDWRQDARQEFLRLRGAAPAWGYRQRGAAAVEPTVLACLGLLATRAATAAPSASSPRSVTGEASDAALAVIAASSDWLARLQRPDGALGLAPTQPAPGWTTPLGLLLWQAGAGHEAQCQRAVEWLLRLEGERMSPADDPEHIVGHDTMLVGWPWVAGTHSWLEPTALAVLALRRAGLDTNPRVVEGYRLIRDRAIVTGGWNYGNKSAFGNPLRPQPAPTGLALLALAQRDERTPTVARAIRYLHATLPTVRASASLGWGLLGLRAWSSAPEQADRWLAEAYQRATGRSDAAAKLSVLLIAGGEHALELFSEMSDSKGASAEASRADLRRRSFIVGAGAVVAAGLGSKLLYGANEAGRRADVFVARAGSYDEDLETRIRDGLTALGLGRAQVVGKSVMLKPNLVEPSREAPQVNTHPALVRAVALVFRRWQAREVFVAEGQGHCRDSELVLEQSGLGPVLDAEKIEFVDLNHDEVFLVPNRLGFTNLAKLGLPATLHRADLIVSLPKLKTHHWAGVTLAMKNLFGVMPGVFYGWPKNVLHHAGIPGSILDINAAVRPHLAIVDGIIGMEGDGPIMGTPRHAGILVMGTNLPAVDATAARLMGINPWRVSYLASASGRLGPIAERHITQRGELIAPLVQNFRLLDHPSLAVLRS